MATRKATLKDVHKANRAGAADAAARKAGRKGSAETSRDIEGKHPALLGLGTLPGIRKDAKGAVLEQIGQADLKTVPAADLVLTKDDMTLAESITKEFHDDNTKYQTLKEQVDAKKGGLTSIMHKLAVRAAERTEAHPQYRLAFFFRLTEYAEAKAKADYKKAKGVNEEPSVKLAIGASWQTYKSQIARGIQAGYNPAQFESGTEFRKVIPPIGGNRAPRTPKGAADIGAAAEVLTDPMISGSMAALIAAVKAAPEMKRDEVADILGDAMHAIEALKAKGKRKGAETDEEKATVAM